MRRDDTMFADDDEAGQRAPRRGHRLAAIRSTVETAVDDFRERQRSRQDEEAEEHRRLVALFEAGNIDHLHGNENEGYARFCAGLQQALGKNFFRPTWNSFHNDSDFFVAIFKGTNPQGNVLRHTDGSAVTITSRAITYNPTRDTEFTLEDAFEMALLASHNKDMLRRPVKLEGTPEEQAKLRYAIEQVNAALDADQNIIIKPSRIQLPDFDPEGFTLDRYLEKMAAVPASFASIRAQAPEPPPPPRQEPEPRREPRAQRQPRPEPPREPLFPPDERTPLPPLFGDGETPAAEGIDISLLSARLKEAIDETRAIDSRVPYPPQGSVRAGYIKTWLGDDPVHCLPMKLDGDQGYALVYMKKKSRQAGEIIAVETGGEDGLDVSPKYAKRFTKNGPDDFYFNGDFEYPEVRDLNPERDVLLQSRIRNTPPAEAEEDDDLVLDVVIERDEEEAAPEDAPGEERPGFWQRWGDRAREFFNRGGGAVLAIPLVLPLLSMSPANSNVSRTAPLRASALLESVDLSDNVATTVNLNISPAQASLVPSGRLPVAPDELVFAQVGSSDAGLADIVYKSGRVNLEGLNPVLEEHFVTIRDVWQECAPGKTPNFTSAHDQFEEHGANSLHREGAAVDIQTINGTHHERLSLAEARRCYDGLREALPNLTILWERQRAGHDHFHIHVPREGDTAVHRIVLPRRQRAASVTAAAVVPEVPANDILPEANIAIADPVAATALEGTAVASSESQALSQPAPTL